jgi:hypothetical protein
VAAPADAQPLARVEPPAKKEAAAPANGAAAATAPRLVEVRLALSGVAAETLSDLRVRRLLEIELEDQALLAPGATGPLGDHVAYVWVDLPTATTVLIEVRVGERAVARRELAVAGLASDVVARFVAIAASEMVRAQMRPVRPRRAAPPAKRPSPEQLEIEARDATAFSMSGAWAVAALPGADGFLSGPALALGLRSRRATQSVVGRWLGGGAEGGGLRWFEVGVSGDYRLWLRPSWRVALGAVATLASLRVVDAHAVDGVTGERDTWSARVGGVIATEWQLSPSTWMNLGLEPGVILRPASFLDSEGARGSVEGAWLGATLGVQLER